jgi:CheY-like chemotaxis protein
MIRQVVAHALRFEGYQVRSASNGLEALDAVEHERPAVVLLDMRMPVLDGWGFARELRARGSDVPIIVMTAACDPQLWADQIGAQACLSKPFSLTELASTVGRFAAPECHADRDERDTAQLSAA